MTSTARVPMLPFIIIVLIVLSIGSALVCHGMARRRGDDGATWALMGLLLGPLAFPLLWLMLGRGQSTPWADTPVTARLKPRR